MSEDQKKEYLTKYRMQQAKIERIMYMSKENPDRKIFYDKQIVSAIELRNKIESDIQAIDGGVLSEILFQKYLCGKSLEEISFCLNYSPRQIQRLYHKAINLLDIK